METPKPHRALSVVVPTFREAANIPALAERLNEALAESAMEWELLLVDDDSNDGSEAIAQQLAEAAAGANGRAPGDRAGTSPCQSCTASGWPDSTDWW